VSVGEAQVPLEEREARLAQFLRSHPIRLTNKERTELFPCTQCGACCRTTEALEAIGLSVKDDGSCEHLTETADDEGHAIYECEIYQDRPDICRVDRSCFDRTSEEDYVEWTAEICNILQLKEGLPERYRVNIRKA
jgi:uncharacterized protein